MAALEKSNFAIEAFQSIAADELVAYSFVAIFARFEYALKRSMFAKTDKYDNVFADIMKFARDVVDPSIASIQDAEFVNARDFLHSMPPDRQVLQQDGTISWGSNRKREDETDGEYLLRIVKDVRNNLFHGGKFPDPVGHVEAEKLRNGELLKACIVVIRECVRACPTVAKHFDTEDSQQGI